MYAHDIESDQMRSIAKARLIDISSVKHSCVVTLMTMFDFGTNLRFYLIFGSRVTHVRFEGKVRAEHSSDFRVLHANRSRINAKGR